MASQKVPFKSLALSRDLIVRLKNRGLTILAQTQDTDGFPVAQISGGADDALWLHITTDFADSEAQGKVDGLGLEQRVYAPHIVNILKEVVSVDAATPAYQSALQIVLMECSKLGTAIKVYDNAGGVADSVGEAASFAAAQAAAVVLATEYASDDIHPLTAQV